MYKTHYKNYKIVNLTVIILLVAGIFIFIGNKTIQSPVPVAQVPVITGNVNDLVTLSVGANQTVSGPMVITGEIKNGYFFEANIVIKVMDVNNVVLLTTNGTATTDWMTAGPVAFTSNVNFTGLPVGPAQLVIENDNPSGDPINLKQIFIPIIIQ